MNFRWRYAERTTSHDPISSTSMDPRIQYHRGHRCWLGIFPAESDGELSSETACRCCIEAIRLARPGPVRSTTYSTTPWPPFCSSSKVYTRRRVLNTLLEFSSLVHE